MFLSISRSNKLHILGETTFKTLGAHVCMLVNISVKFVTYRWMDKHKSICPPVSMRDITKLEQEGHDGPISLT